MITIKVSHADIDKGVRMKITKCPIARACKRATKAKETYAYHLLGFKFTSSSEYVVKTPTKVFEWIIRFDKGEKMKPFTFTIKSKRMENAIKNR